MALPKSIQKQAEKAQELAEQAASQTNPQPVAETPPDPGPTEQPPSPAEVQPAPTADDWEQKYKSLRGKYDAQVPQLSKQVSELTSQLTVLTAKLEGLSATPEPAKEAPKPLVTDKDVEAYGSDLIDLVKRQAMEVAADMNKELQIKLGALEKENQQLRDQLGGVSEQQGAERQRGYLADLTRLVPDWKVINEDPRFIEWLQVVDPLGGVPRQGYLETAYQNADAERTAVIFNAWKQSLAPTQQPPANTPSPLERQVSPNTSRANTPANAADAGTRVWSAAEIRQFYTDVRQRKYAGREAEQARIESEINAAAASGRVTS